MRKFISYFFILFLFLYGTGCSVIKLSQSATHPLVNEIDKNNRSANQLGYAKKSKDTTQPMAVNNHKPQSNFNTSEIKKESSLKTENLSDKNVTKNSIEPKGIAKNLVEEAEKYLGTPYKIGGTTKLGMDCSGLVMTVYKTQGIQLPRVSPDQYKFGKPISVEQVLPGDLLFFSTPSKPHQIGHSAMCVAIEEGKIKFIHAASTGVRYDYLTPGYYAKHFIGACRVIDKNFTSQK